MTIALPPTSPYLVGLPPEAGGPKPPLPLERPEASFGDVLRSAVERASQSGHTAADMARALADGSLDDLHGTAIAAKEAEISVKLVGAVRNKLLDAFHELWRTNV